MKGTLVNAAAVVLGGAIGMLLKKSVRESWQSSINKALGICVFIIGLNGVIANMFSYQDGKLTSSGELLLVASLVIGTLLGEIIGVDAALEKLSVNIEKKFPVAGFAAGFMNATVLFCVGAMAIVGSISDGLTGDATTLYVKSTLDFTSAIILASALGGGVIFSAIPILLYQGAITLFAGALERILVGELLSQVCAVGYGIIMCIGVNFLSSEKIKTANMLPSILVPVVFSYIVKLIKLFF